MEKLYGAKPQAYLEKPITPRELLNLVRKIL
jgi:hypothetical protein